MLTNKKKKSIVVLVELMSGSIDWILPVCKYLKDHHSETDISFVLLRFGENDIFNENLFLKKIVEELTCKRCYDLTCFLPYFYGMVKSFFPSKIFGTKPARIMEKIFWCAFGKRRVRRWLYKHHPDVLLKDGSFKPFSPIFDVFFQAARKIGCKVVVFPMAPSFTFAPDMWIEKKSIDIIRRGDREDYFMVNNDWDADHFRAGGIRTVIVGTPKFDSDWMEYLKSKCDGSGDDFKNPGKKILLLLKNEFSTIFNYINFKDTLKDILAAVIEATDYSIVIKPHPRQDLGLLNDVISQYAGYRINISHQPIFKLANEAKCVIAMPTGAILDVLFTGRVVVEYFNYRRLNSELMKRYGEIPRNSLGGMSFLDGNGCLTSVFRGKGMVIPADNPEELKVAINQMEKEESKKYFLKTRDIFFKRDANKKAAEFILSL